VNRQELEGLTKKDLSVLARDAEITGRSTMTKAQLVDALITSESEPAEAVEAEVVSDGLGIAIPGISHEAPRHAGSMGTGRLLIGRSL
jgi:hypothetical protein